MSVEPQPQKQRKTIKVRQACECCRSRKIRCDNYSPCQNCQRIGASCVYQAPKKKGPKRRFREEDIIQTLSDQQFMDETKVDSQASSILSSEFRTSSSISLEIIQHCLDFFFAHKYPLMPILDKNEIYNSIHQLDQSATYYGLVTALCAMVALHKEFSIPTMEDYTLTPAGRMNAQLDVEFLVNETIRARTYCNEIDNPSLESVQTSFFMYTCLSSLGRDNAAWFYLRESITMLQLLRLHEEDTYGTMTDSRHAQFCRRTFWVLFNAERSHALQRHRPLTLRRSIDLPTVNESSEELEDKILLGFLDAITLFRNFGDAFLTLWNASKNSTPISTQSLVQLQDFLQCSIPNVGERLHSQQAYLLVNRQWLKMLVWQVCLRKGLLSSNPISNNLSFHFPVELAREIILISRLLPLDSFQANGLEILEKIFDIGCSLADVLLVHPSLLQASAFEVGPKDYLMDLVRILGMDIEGNSRFLGILAARADECLGVRLPRNLSSPGGLEGVYEFDWEQDGDDSDEIYDSPHSSLASR